jgi:hypothetical protein
MALLLMPLVIKLTMSGMISTMMMMAMRLLFATIIAEGGDDGDNMDWTSADTGDTGWDETPEGTARDQGI